MVKFLIRFLLSLSILLLSGYSYLYAHSHQEGAFSSLKKNLKEADQSGVSFFRSSSAFTIQSSSSNTEKPPVKIEAAEIIEIEEEEDKDENDKLIALKKHSESSNHFAAIFNDLVFGSLFQGDCIDFPFWKSFSYHSSYRLYLIFRVFRI